MDGKETQRKAKVVETSTITLGPEDTALVFRPDVLELILPDTPDDSPASASSLLATAIRMEIQKNPEGIQNMVDKHLMFSGLNVVATDSSVSPETPKEDDDGSE